MIDFNRILKAWFPPVLTDTYKSWRGLGIHFRGDYPDWAAAAAKTGGYDAEQILERVRWASIQVATGEANGERDSVLFPRTPYPFPVIATLLRAATENNERLNVLDFGGALGSSYQQCKNFLQQLRSLHWGIVEQLHYVNCGRREFENESLRFYETIESSVNAFRPHVILASGVLQYVPKPGEVLKSFVLAGPDYIVIDRTPISLSGRQVISTQIVPGSICSSSYPLWIFNENQLKEYLLVEYEELASFPAVDGTLGHGSLKANFKGFIFKKRTSA